jgi:hypothetical protein
MRLGRERERKVDYGTTSFSTLTYSPLSVGSLYGIAGGMFSYVGGEVFVVPV